MLKHQQKTIFMYEEQLREKLWRFLNLCLNVFLLFWNSKCVEIKCLPHFSSFHGGKCGKIIYLAWENLWLWIYYLNLCAHGLVKRYINYKYRQNFTLQDKRRRKTIMNFQFYNPFLLLFFKILCNQIWRQTRVKV